MQGREETGGDKETWSIRGLAWCPLKTSNTSSTGIGMDWVTGLDLVPRAESGAVNLGDSVSQS